MKTSLLISWRGIVIILAALMSIFSIWLVYVDQNMSWRWVAFGLHLASVATIVIATLVRRHNRNRESTPHHSSKFKLSAFIFIIAYSIFMNSLFLTTYPFVAEGDEVRDGGLETMEIAIGTRKNIFGWGAYDSHGLIIPTLTSFLYRLMPGNVLVWRLPAMTVGVIGVISLFLFMSKTTARATAFWSAFVLANLPLHLYYSRTQLVVIWSSTLAMLLLIGMTHFLKKRTVTTIVLVATLAGFFSTFYTSMRTVATFLIGLVSVISIVDAIKMHRSWRWRTLQTMKHLWLIILFFTLGFGPRLLYSPPRIFFQRSRALPLETFSGLSFSSIQKDVSILHNRYQESLLVYGVKPTASWYPDHRPILPEFLYPFFLVGILVALTTHRSTMWPVLMLAAIIPLTNSAITEGVNFDHRLAPLFPISAMLTGIGISWFLKNIRQARWLWTVSTLTITVAILWMGASFFVNQPANKEKTIRQYVSMHLVKFLSDRKRSLGDHRYCLYVHPELVEYFNFMHIREQYAYFVPGFSYETRSSPPLRLGKNEVYISRSCTETAQRMLLYRISCSNGRIMKSLFCPAHGEHYLDIRIWGEQGVFQ